jgi:hypothetical protein
MTVSIWLLSLTKHLFCRNVQLAHLSWERGGAVAKLCMPGGKTDRI